MKQADDKKKTNEYNAENHVGPLIVFIGKHNENKLRKTNVKCMFI